MPLYVCEHRYKEEAKVFKKIKIWESCLPEIVKKADYPLVENVGGAIEVLRKVKSPFVLGGAGTGGIGGTVRGGVKATPVAAPAAGGTRSQRNAPPTPAAVPAAVGVKIHHPAGGPNNLTPSQMAVTSQKFDDVLPRSLRESCSLYCSEVLEDLLTPCPTGLVLQSVNSSAIPYLATSCGSLLPQSCMPEREWALEQSVARSYEAGMDTP